VGVDRAQALVDETDLNGGDAFRHHGSIRARTLRGGSFMPVE